MHSPWHLAVVHTFPKLSCAYIFRTLFFSFILHYKRLIVNDDDDRMIMLTWHKWFSSISISNFDNSFTDNCLSVHQTNDCSGVGNLGHLLRKPTARILLHTTRRHLSLCHLHIEIWFLRQMYIPGGPIDMTQKITHCWGDIFRAVLLCWAKHRGISEWLPI